MTDLKITIPFFITALSIWSSWLNAQIISVHPTEPDSVWYYNVTKELPYAPFLSCKAGESQHFRYHVSSDWESTLHYLDNTIQSDKKEWTEQDINEAVENFNKENAELLKKLLEEKNEERQTDLEEDPLMDELEQECLDELDEFQELWDKKICIMDCPPNTEECILIIENRGIGEQIIEYQLKQTSINHSGEGDEDAKPPYEVIISYSLVLHAEAWIYFQATCICSDLGYVSVPPGRIEPPWDQIDLTGKEMKPFYVPIVPVKSSSPLVPILIGVVGVGTLTYIILQDDTNPEDCSFTASAQASPSSCSLPNGSIVVTINSSAEVEYLWSTGATTKDLLEVAAGNYTVTITRTGTTCTQVLSATVNNVDQPITTDITTQDADCGMQNGSITISVSPPAFYTYAWSTGSTEQNQSQLAPGNYMLTVTVAGTCMETYNITVGELQPSFDISFQSSPATCGLSDGSTIAIAAPKNEYEYVWSDGQTGAAATDLEAGTYTVTVSIAGTNCSREATVTIDELPPSFTVSISTTPAGCGLTDGTATATVDPPGTYDFIWSSGHTGPQVTGLGSGFYTLTVSIAGTTCSQEVGTTVEELPASITLSFTSTPAGCGLANGTATVNIDPPGAYSILWSTGSTEMQITNVASGAYTVTVTLTGTMCSTADTVSVEQAGGGFTATFTTDNADCGLSNGSVTVTIDPPGEYTYLWSGQQTGPVLQQVSAGTYSVTATDMNACTETFTVTVGQDPAEYITINTTTPGNCTGGGEINFTVTTPGAGPMDIQITGPEGTTNITVPPGSYNLSTFLTILPGTYSMTVTDQQIGSACGETMETTVQDTTPPLIVADDFYNTIGTQPVEENVLDNDTGLGDGVTISVFNVIGGTVTFSSSGDFVFIADSGFSGDASFTYTVTNACGNTDTGIVIIFVEVVVCEFEVEFETTNASCGLEDGVITVDVIEPGSYEYLWNTGDSGPTIQNIFAGTYTVTITDLNLGCDLAFTVSLAENPADYIEDITVIQPTCGNPGEIQFTAFTSSQNDLVMTVFHPNGSNVFTVEPGLIRLSDYISITPGDYIVEVSDEGAGPDCFESFEVTLDPPPMLEIVEEAVFPPSEPTAMDGFAVIVVTVPGMLPYSIFLNGIPYGTANDNTFQVLGLGVGEYDIQIIDAAGCMSNILTINVPFPDIILSFGTGITNASLENATNETPTLPPTSQWRSNLLTTIQYHLVGRPQEIRFMYVPPSSNRNSNPRNSFIELQYLTEIKKVKWKNLKLVVQGGIDIQFAPSVSTEALTLPYFWMFKASAGYRFKNLLNLQGSFSLRGWEKIERPVMDVSITLPLTGYSIRPVIGNQ